MKRRRGLLFTITVVLTLCAACGVWLHVQRQQYERNRQLIAALVHNDTKTALALVNAGAAPNTRQFPAPAPSLKSLLEHLLHHTPPPANDTPTAFLLACGALVLPMDGNRLSGPPPEENRPLLQAMLAHGADVHARANGNRTALPCAVMGRRLYTAELLLTHGADVNAQAADGSPPLMYATSARNVEMTHLLLTHGAKPNVQDSDGWTPLARAVLSDSDVNLVRDLLAHGANPNIKGPDGNTPLSFARQQHLSHLIPLLRRGAKQE